MLLLVFIILGASEAAAQSGGFNQACGIINSLQCDQFTNSLVCGSNGVIYTSECHFAKASCADTSLRANATCAITTMPAPVANTTIQPSNYTLPPNDTSTSNTSMQPGWPSTTVQTMPPQVGQNLTTSQIDLNMTTTMMPMNWTTDSSLGNDSTTPNTTMLTPAPTMTTSVNVDNTTISTPRPTDGLSAVCKIIISLPCEPEDSPICASGDAEFPSLCEFTHAQCYDPDLSIVHRGPCFKTTTKAPTVEDLICEAILSKPCNDDGVILCGSDGITYSNSCEFEKGRCTHPEL